MPHYEERNCGTDTENASHQAMFHAQWSKALPRAENWTPPHDATPFAGVFNGQAHDHATYYLACQPLVDQLWLQNPVEPEMLGPYPVNPFPEEEWPERLREAGFGDLDPKVVFGAGLQLASRTLVLSYLSVIDKPMMAGQLSRAPSDTILVDPLAGMVLWREGDRTRNQHLAWVSTTRWLTQSSENAKIFRSRGIQDEIMAEGAIIGRELFSGVLHNQARRAYKRFEVAETIARDRREFDRRIEQLRDAVARHGGDFEIWFRGQTSDFLVQDRSVLVNEGVTPYSNIRDSSLVPSIYREADKHFKEPKRYEAFARALGEWSTAVTMLSTNAQVEKGPFPEFPAPLADIPIGTVQRINVSFTPNSNDASPLFGVGMQSIRELVAPDGQVIDRTLVNLDPGRKAVTTGLVLQHYGCPTAWLDITKDPEVALWFAMHEFSAFTPEGASPSRYSVWPTAQHEWPTIYVFALSKEREHPFLDTQRLVDPALALRPSRQCCGLLGGPANLVRNYGARLIALKIRLGPGMASAELRPAEYYFPSKDEDPILAGLVRGMVDDHDRTPLFPPWYITS